MKKLIFASVCASLFALGSTANENHSAPHWDYDTHGPACWEGLLKSVKKGICNLLLTLKRKRAKLLKVHLKSK